MAFGGGKKDKELQDKIEFLSEENRLLRRKLRLLTGNSGGAALSMNSLGGYASLSARAASLSGQAASLVGGKPAGAPVGPAGAPGGQASIVGLDTAYLIVDKDYKLTQINSKMTALAGCDKSAATQHKPVTDIDNLDWAPQVFTTLLQDAKQAGDGAPSEFEAKRPNLEGGKDKHYHFKAIWNGDSGTVTMDDITLLKTTREFFERLVSPNIVSQLLDSGDDPFKVEKRHMSVLFGDLRNFTKFCDNVPAENVRTVFDEFFHLCVGAIARNEATLDKFIGDQVMALFSAPVTHPGHAYKSIHVAVDIQRGMKELRQSWIERGLVPPQLVQQYPDILKLGIGINTGEMIVGMFGDERNNQYTVLGHTVNMGARFCSHAAGDEILAGMASLDDVKKYYAENPAGFDLAIKFRSKGNITVKGVAEPVPVAVVVYDEG